MTLGFYTKMCFLLTALKLFRQVLEVCGFPWGKWTDYAFITLCYSLSLGTKRACLFLSLLESLLKIALSYSTPSFSLHSVQTLVEKARCMLVCLWSRDGKVDRNKTPFLLLCFSYRFLFCHAESFLCSNSPHVTRILINTASPGNCLNSSVRNNLPCNQILIFTSWA